MSGRNLVFILHRIAGSHHFLDVPPTGERRSGWRT
jgi:hypothetical protein